MPINRAGLKLSLPSLNVGPASERPQMPSTNGDLKTNFHSLHNQMRQMPMSHFREARDAPDYSGMRQSGFFAMSQGFQLESHGGDVFMHAHREHPQCKGEFAGDKFHISVQPEQVPQAFQALSGLLFSVDSPIDKWKVTDMERVDQQSRVAVGAQFTLYVKPDQENSQYSASSLHNTRQFIECLESRLSESGLMPGQYPESDVHPENWKYVSYRNELRSGRDGGEMQSQALREEPFYRLMAE
ncbi:type III secretion system effector phosphothreonine lyase [Chromobacterium violaceum]|uniref:type III secretion system effector phosphothreonine lyase n=1 Tax=Chromobacterium violaceum TaxID=536 RepID=UPI0009DA6D2C|nr:type III secretion system effector phosphothreonine lyase [Chromobacterium violaceum]MBP4050661.1 type III secretion system effector phosphothreonine lyase [Chromobacterium violaceum]OQS22790.1 type III effector phosphothreonine lyase [Chromobacterium violaceum]